jgi:hypothetical protein
MSLRWTSRAEASFRRSLLGDLLSFEVKPQVDPLRWVVHLRLRRHFTRQEIPILRSLLREWCEANDAVYHKSQWNKWDFKALIFIKGLGPVQDNSPFDQR